MSDSEPILQDAEAIIEAAAHEIAETGAALEAKVVQLQRLANISHDDAHKAFDNYLRAMFAAAKASGKPMDEFMETVSNERKLVILGMTVGAMMAGMELQIEWVDPSAKPE